MEFARRQHSASASFAYNNIFLCAQLTFCRLFAPKLRQSNGLCECDREKYFYLAHSVRGVRAAGARLKATIFHFYHSPAVTLTRYLIFQQHLEYFFDGAIRTCLNKCIQENCTANIISNICFWKKLIVLVYELMESVRVCAFLSCDKSSYEMWLRQ